MEKLQRYGVAALVFIVMTILGVAIWDTGEGSNPVARARSVVVGRPAAAQSPSSVRRNRAGEQGRPPMSSVASQGRGSATSGRVPAARSAYQRPGPSAPRSGASTARPGASAPASTAALASGGSSAERFPGRPASAGAQPRPPAQNQTLTGTRPVEERATTVASTTGQPRSYTVQPGDTLSEIAAEQLGSATRWREIVSLNPRIDPRRLSVKQKITLPPRGSAAPQPAAVPPHREVASSASRSGGFYTIRPGDTLSGISQALLGSAQRWSEIARLNPGLDPGRMGVGDRIRVPEGDRLSAPVVVASNTTARSGRPRVR